MVPGFLTDLNVVSIIVFLAVLAGLVWRDRKNIERYSVVLVRRTKKGIHYLDKTASLNPRAWRWWSTAGVVVGFIVMVWVVITILAQTLKLFLVGDATPPVGPVLPTVSTMTDPAQAGYWGIPFWHFLIGLSIVMIVHEMMHGVIARVEGFNIEYVGLILLGPIPGAFVQPEGQRDFFEKTDEEQHSPWDQGNWLSRLRVLAAGPAANMTVALLLGALVFGAVTMAHGGIEIRGAYEHTGIRVVNVTTDSAAGTAGMEPGMVITAIDGQPTMDLPQFETAMTGKQVGDTITVGTRGNGTFTLMLGSPPEAAGNMSFTPALIDVFLPGLERSFPGTIATYEQYNDVLVPDDVSYRIARWQWIADNYPELQATAADHITMLEQQRPARNEGYMGVFIVPDREVNQTMAPFIPALFFILQILFVVAALNLMVGAANLLPVKGLDGGWMVDVLMNRFAPRYQGRVVRTLTIVTLLAIAVSFSFLIARVIV